MKIMVCELSQENIYEASGLLAQYRLLNPVDERHASECKQALEQLLRYPNAYCLLARIGDEYAGFLSYSWGFSTSKGLPILRIQDVFTAPLHRRVGVAKALLEHAVSIAEIQGANRLQLETDLNNDAARALYTEIGFEWISQKIVYMYPLNQWHA